MSRFDMTRPATDTDVPAFAANASASVRARFERAGYGFFPATRSASSFLRRASRSSRADKSRGLSLCVVISGASSFVIVPRFLFYLQNIVHLQSGRHPDADRLAGALAHKRLPKRRLVRDSAFCRVGFLVPHNRVFLIHAVRSRDQCRANPDKSGSSGQFSNDLGVRENILNFPRAPLRPREILPRLMILGIFGEVSHLLRVIDSFGDFRYRRFLQPAKLPLDNCHLLLADELFFVVYRACV